jgi:hypothetical protein
MSALYIRLRTGFYTHRKTARLRAIIGDAAFWVPPRLWAYCAEHQPDGNLSSYSSEELAMLVGCLEQSSSILGALKACGFVDNDGMIHGWEEHNGYHKSYSLRAKAAAEARWSKKKEPKKKEKDKDRDIGDKHCLTHACSIYDAYPKRVGKPKALISIQKAVEQFGFEFVMEKTAAYALSRKGEEAQFTPLPATWFNQQRFNDDPSTWKNKTYGTNAINRNTGLVGHKPGEEPRAVRILRERAERAAAEKALSTQNAVATEVVGHGNDASRHPILSGLG